MQELLQGKRAGMGRETPPQPKAKAMPRDRPGASSVSRDSAKRTRSGPVPGDQPSPILREFYELLQVAPYGVLGLRLNKQSSVVSAAPEPGSDTIIG